MNEKPILFSGPMVRALLSGAKSQTRRAVKYATGLVGGLSSYSYDGPCPANPHQHLFSCGATIARVTCPYGTAGTKLWVKENYCVNKWEWSGKFKYDGIRLIGKYTVDASPFDIALPTRESVLFYERKRPIGNMSGRFMYRSLSRITLEITSVRVERVRAISTEDIFAEGIERHHVDRPVLMSHAISAGFQWAELWQKINGKESWERNDWVWRIEFKRNGEATPSCRPSPPSSSAPISKQ